MGMFASAQVMELHGGSAVAVRGIRPWHLIWLYPSTDIFLPFGALCKFVSNNLVLTLKKCYATTLYRFNIYKIYIKEKNVLDKYNSPISQRLT